MKRILTKIKGIIKGAPTAVLASAAIHLILLVVAGGFVVFSMVDPPAQAFVPATKFERPKMKLKKMRVKMKQNVMPKASTQRIMSQTMEAMPDLQLPEMSGLSRGISEGVGGFELLGDTSHMTLFGGKNRTLFGNEFEGTFYSMELTRSGTFEPIGLARAV